MIQFRYESYDNNLYWQLDDVIIKGETGACNPPSKCPSTPNPAPGSDEIPTTPEMGWDAVDDATEYDIYFGDTDDPTLVDTVEYPAWGTPNMLYPGTTYYWSVVPRNGCGEAVGCEVWSFTTQGDPCVYEISPTSSGFPESGGTGSIDVTTEPNCPWQAVSGTPWILITGGTSGAESGTVTYEVEPHTEASSRFANLTVAGLTHTVYQTGVQPPPCDAFRVLPGGYDSRSGLRVEIQVTSLGNVEEYTAEESLPAEWGITDISHSGQYEAQNHKVRWGPFVDGDPRILSYTAIPPDGATETGTFSGVLMVDGQTQVVCGNIEVSPGDPHPADTNGNWLLDMDEVTAYGNAWRTGEIWGGGPNPISIGFVTRACEIWRVGEAYAVKTTDDPPYQPR